MACVFSLVQKLRVKGIRELSTGTCVIKGFHQDVFFPDCKWESLSDHIAKFPLVSSVRGRLIKVDPRYSLKINDHWRKLLFTGFLQSFICKQQGDCILNAYDLRNVGVIKLRGFNILGFQKFERARGMKNTNHDEFISFVHNLFAEFCGPLALQQVCDLNTYLGVLSGESLYLQKVCNQIQFIGGLPDLSMLCNPIFLNDDQMANFYVDAHRLVRHQFPVRSAGHKTACILRDMESIYWANHLCVKACQESLLLKHLLGRHEKTAERVKLYKEPRFGSAVVDIPRIAVTHSIEIDVLNKARKECTSLSDLDLLDNFSRAEVIEGVRHMFDLYPQAMICSFLANREWPQLKMEERLPCPASLDTFHHGIRQSECSLGCCC